ncbi:cell division protein SepF [Brevibacterium sp. BRM-1]|uniref:cell division protein SepF n=1 Tax=Brevibacterium sp. BRM-1 TaxID=2999062 RepID=UPI00227E1DF4|nr:cell division protein SepF [Brevibacterium sp. BRM-1]WAL41079.1 cell division protein SepF [Brevibacterium sp. BRM-1]
MSTLKKIGNYFGFGDEEEYYDEPAPRRREVREEYEVEDYGVEDDYAEPEPVREAAPVTPIRQSMRPVEAAAPSAMQRIQTIHPRSYNDAKSIGTAFRDGIPVIMNLSAMDEANSKRLVDFSAGLIFGLRGSIEKVTNSVFLLTPENIEVASEAEPTADQHASFFNQS